MKSSAYLIRLTRVLILGAVVAGTTASVAGAYNSRPPDVRDAADAITGTYLGSPPDVRDTAAAVQTAVPDVFERYAAAHPYGVGLSSATQSTLVGRPPDVRDAAEATSLLTPQGLRADGLRLQAIAEAYQQSGQVTVPGLNGAAEVGRPPDISDVAGSSRSPAQTMALHFRHEDLLYRDRPSISASLKAGTSTRGFDWNDYGVGIGTGIGLVLLFAGGLAGVRQLRHPAQAA